MHTLDMRESRSSLAGVMMAAAMEGMGIYEFTKHVAPRFEAIPEAVNDVLSRVHLPATPWARGAGRRPARRRRRRWRRPAGPPAWTPLPRGRRRRRRRGCR